MNLLSQQIAAGLANGAIYACMALALVMIFQAIGHINFAQGEMATVSTFFAASLMESGTPYWAAFFLSVAVSFVAGAAISWILFRPMRHAPALTIMAMFVGLYAILNSLAGFFWGFTPRAFPSPFGAAPLFGGLVSAHQAGMIAAIVILLSALHAFFAFSRLGMAMRAAAESPVSAALAGIRVARMAALGWGMAAALGAVAGMLIAPIVMLEPNMMMSVLLYGFAGATLGGLSSPGGAVLGGFLLGIIENLASYIPVVGGELKLSLALAIIVIALIFRPAGLFGRALAARA